MHDEIKQWRLRHGMSQKGLAGELGVHPKTVRRWENGESVPYPYHQEQLAALGFVQSSQSPEDLYGLVSKARPSMEQEQPSTYFVQDRGNLQEITRLVEQDALFTRAMKGILSEQPHPERFTRVLDVGCGTGGWLIDAAKAYPTMHTLIGVDISKTILEYAEAQAHDAGIADRVEFKVMDALRMLEFPDTYFDLVNMRLGSSFLRLWDWPKLLQEFRRVLRPGGVLRISDTLLGEIRTQSPTTNRLHTLIFQALQQAGHIFPEDFGQKLTYLLEQYRFDQIGMVRYAPTYTADMLDCQLCVKDVTRVFRTALPFMQKWIAVPDNYEELYQQMLQEMHQPDFWGTWPALTVYGTRLP